MHWYCNQLGFYCRYINIVQCSLVEIQYSMHVHVGNVATLHSYINYSIISTNEDLRIESSAIINLRGVSTKLNKYIIVLYHKLIFIFCKLMFWLVDLYNVSFFYMTTTHGRAVILCMNFLLHGKDGRMLKLLKVDLREDCKANFGGNVIKG